MNYASLVKLLGNQGWFDIASLAQLSGEEGGSLIVQLHRWMKSGKLISLRRGMYAFPESFRCDPLNVSRLANELYAPSYLSTYWALGFYGMIPEMVVTYTSVTSRVTRTFTNTFGKFSYRNLKPSAFFGCRSVVMNDQPVMLAEPEKALLDLCHLESGAWTLERMREMRFQQMELVNAEKLRDYAGRFSSPRLIKVVEAWDQLVNEQECGVAL
jgi:hypothetical protein